MPSTRDPVVVVQPGPGRLPANTVPANALIFPSTGGTDAALQAHITDPVGAHAATAISTVAGPAWLDGEPNNAITAQARIDEIVTDLVSTSAMARIGQPGYAGATWNVASGAVHPALTELFQSANARPVWVLDANASNNADFTGASALINAVAAIGTARPILYLREGTYNWTDPSATALDDVVVIGAKKSTTIIQNLAGQMRVGARTRMENVTISVSTNFTLLGGSAYIKDVAVSATSDCFASSNSNVVVNLSGTGAQYMTVVGTDNRFEGLFNIQMQVDASATRTTVDGMLWSGGTALKYLTDSVLTIDGADGSYSDVTVSGSLGNISDYPVVVFGNRNRLTRLVVDGVPDPAVNGITYVWVSGDNNTLNGVVCTNVVSPAFPVFQVGGGASTANGNVITGLLIDTVSGGQDELVRLDGTNNTINGVEVRNVTTQAASQALVVVTGTSNVAESISCTSATSLDSTCVAVTGANSSANGVHVQSMTTPGAGFKAVEVGGDSCKVRDVRVSSIGGLPTTGRLVDVVSSAENAIIDGVVLASMTTPAGRFVNISGTGCRVENVHITSTGILQAGCNLITVAGTSNALHRVHIENLPSVSGATEALVVLTGSGMDVNGILFQSIGTTAAITLSLIRTAGDGRVANVFAEDLGGTNLRFGKGIEVQANASGHPMDFEACTISVVATANDNVFHSVSVSSPVNVRDCTFLGRGAGAVASSAVTFVSGCRNFSFTNCVSRSLSGHAGAFPNTGAVLTNVEFSADSFNPNAGLQLFHGYGFAGGTITKPLVLRDCVMEYSTSNVNPSSGTGSGEPVIFFGGIGGTITANHGPIAIDGLDIHPSSAVTAQHRDSLVVIDVASTSRGILSKFDNITIDLKELPWTATGSARGTFTTDAAIMEIVGPSGMTAVQTPGAFTNLSILNIKEGSITDARMFVFARGVKIDGLVIEGPASATHGAGSFSSTLNFFEQAVVNDFVMFRNEGITMSGSISRMASVTNSKVTRGVMRSTQATSDFGSYFQILSGAGSIVQGVYIEHAGGALDSVFSFPSGGDNGVVKDNHVVFTVGADATFASMSNTSDATIENNKCIAIAGANPTAVSIAFGVRNTIRGNIFRNFSMNNLSSNEDAVISILDTSNFNIVSENIIEADHTFGLDEAWIPFYIDGDDNLIQGNRAQNTDGSGSLLFIIDTSAQRNSVMGNYLEANHAAPGTVQLNSSGTNNTFVGNVITNLSNTATITINGGGGDVQSANIAT